jgi:hypothetical protein
MLADPVKRPVISPDNYSARWAISNCMYPGKTTASPFHLATPARAG